jgi:hypothetical protein
MVIDQNTDVTFATLRSLVTMYPDLSEHVKTAQVGEHIRDSLPIAAFADQPNRMFPVHTPADAILSKAYATKVANLADSVTTQIDTALDMYGVSQDLFSTPKVAHIQEESPQFLVESQQKLAFYSHTPIAMGEEALIRNQSKLSSNSLSKGALTLVKEAHRRGENVSDWTLKYAGLVQCDSRETRDWLEARAHQTSDSNLKKAYSKLAHVADNLDDSLGRDELIKLANTVSELDNLAGFGKYYGRTLPDPIATVFNTKTAMQPMLDLAGTAVPLEKLLSVAPETYGDILGSDIVDEISKDGDILPDALTEIVDTLPIDMKKSLVKELGL